MLESYGNHSPEIHPTVFVHSTSVVIGNVSVEEQSTLWPNTTLRGDDGAITIGARTSIQDNTVIHMTENLSHTIVGNQVTVGHGVVLHGCLVADNVIVGMGWTKPLPNVIFHSLKVVSHNHALSCSSYRSAQRIASL